MWDSMRSRRCFSRASRSTSSSSSLPEPLRELRESRVPGLPREPFDARRTLLPFFFVFFFFDSSFDAESFCDERSTVVMV